MQSNSFLSSPRPSPLGIVDVLYDLVIEIPQYMLPTLSFPLTHLSANVNQKVPSQGTIIVSFSKDVAHLIVTHAEPRDHDFPSLRKRRHHPVLDSIVNHFDVVPSPARPQLLHTWSSLPILCRYFLQEWHHSVQRLISSSRRYTWALRCGLGPSRHTHTNVMHPDPLELLLSALGGAVVLILGIHDDIALLEERG